MVAMGFALAGAGAIAFVESTRFPPAPAASAGTKEWGTQRTRPPPAAESAPVVDDDVGSASASAEASGEVPFDDLDEPVVDVEVHGSASAPSASSDPWPEEGSR